MKLKMANFAESTLAGALDQTATTVLLEPGTGNRFPALAAGQYFPLTLVKLVAGAPVREIVHVVARVADSCTVIRAREGTPATAFDSGSYAGLRATAEGMAGKADLEGADFTGPVTMADQPLRQAVMQDCGAKVATVAAAVAGVYTVDYQDGPYQVIAPTPGTYSINIINWPPAGVHGELWLEGANLGLCTLTTSVALDYLKTDGSYATTNSVNANQGATLRSNGVDNLLIWGREGAPKRAKVAR